MKVRINFKHKHYLSTNHTENEHDIQLWFYGHMSWKYDMWWVIIVETGLAENICCFLDIPLIFRLHTAHAFFPDRQAGFLRWYNIFYMIFVFLTIMTNL